MEQQKNLSSLLCCFGIFRSFLISLIARYHYQDCTQKGKKKKNEWMKNSSCVNTAQVRFVDNRKGRRWANSRLRWPAAFDLARVINIYLWHTYTERYQSIKYKTICCYTTSDEGCITTKMTIGERNYSPQRWFRSLFFQTSIFMISAPKIYFERLLLRMNHFT